MGSLLLIWVKNIWILFGRLRRKWNRLESRWIFGSRVVWRRWFTGRRFQFKTFFLLDFLIYPEGSIDIEGVERLERVVYYFLHLHAPRGQGAVLNIVFTDTLSAQVLLEFLGLPERGVAVAGAVLFEEGRVPLLAEGWVRGPMGLSEVVVKQTAHVAALTNDYGWLRERQYEERVGKCRTCNWEGASQYAFLFSKLAYLY